MEDLKHGFEGEPAQTPPNHEVRPPQRPEKLPLIERAETPPIDQTEPPSSPVMPNRDNPESADEAVSDSNPRTAQSRGDIDLSRSQRRREREEEQRVRREMEHLRVQLREANNRADQAERAAEELAQQLNSRSQEMTVGGDGSADTVTSLKVENKGLKAELDEARSHIFSLQPYRNDLTPKEVGQDFDDLVNGITDWITNLMDPILDDDDRIDDVLAAVKKRSADLQKLKRYLHSQGDLSHGCMFPETDIDILIAVVMRFLQDHIFQKILFGAVPDTVEAISFVEGSMQTNVEPRRDLFALRTWRAEALNAVICSPDYQRARHGRVRELTTDVASLFKVFKKEKDWNKLCHACQEAIIKPAVKLHEKLMTSTHHFYLDLNPYVMWNARQELEMSPDFLHDLPKLKCENILQNRKPFNVAKLDPRPTKEQLYQGLTNVATVVPALYMRQVGKGDVIKEPTVVRMQQVLVAWGSQEKKEKFLANGERTLIHHLCFSHRERHDRGQEGGSNTVWAQWRSMQW